MRAAILTVLVLASATTTARAQGRLERVHGRLIVEVSGDTDGVQVLVDGQLLTREHWGRPTRVELGSHLVEARRDGEVVSSADAEVPRGGDVHVELDVAPPRAVSEGPIRIEPAARPSAMGETEHEDNYLVADDADDADDADSADDAYQTEPLQDAGEDEEDGGGFAIPAWAWWVGGGVIAAVVLIVVIAAVASSPGPPVEGDLMPGVLRF